MNIVFILANSVNPDEMLHCAAFHLGIHCLPKYCPVQYTGGGGVGERSGSVVECLTRDQRVAGFSLAMCP